MSIDDLPDPAPLDAVAELLGVTPRTLRRRLKEYTHVRIGRFVWFRRPQVEALLATYTRSAAKVVSAPAVQVFDEREVARQQIIAARSKARRKAVAA